MPTSFKLSLCLRSAHHKAVFAFRHRSNNITVKVRTGYTSVLQGESKQKCVSKSGACNASPYLQNNPLKQLNSAK